MFSPSQAAQTARLILTGWGGGKGENVVSNAAEVGFSELVVHHDDAADFRRYIELGRQHGVGIYAWLHLGDIPAWKKAYPDDPPPLQMMSDSENEALKRIEADKTPGKSQYQYGGEPVQELEVLISPLLCFHDPRVLEAFKKQIDEMLKFSGVKGVAFDFIGYRNYTCCRCATSMAQLEVFRKKHPDLSQEQSLQRFSLETLVEFNNRLSAHVRASTAEARVITHVYPVFLPEPLYGNRLDVDVCAQTAAWYFKPYWSLEKIRAYSGVIARDATRYHPRANGAALIGVDRRAHSTKSPERLAEELQAILDGGCSRVQVCATAVVLKDPETAAVFRRFFGRPLNGKPAP